MKRLINYIDKSLLLKIASLNSVAVVTRVLVGFLTSKAIAIFIGPSGMAMVGNLRDVMGSARSISTLGYYNGIVKYISEYRKDALKLRQTISTVLYTIMISSVIISLAIFVGSDYINNLVFEGIEGYAFVFRLLAIALPFYALNMILMASLNGTSKFKLLLKVSIVGHLITGFITIILIWQYHIIGAFVSVIVSELSILIIILLSVKKPDFLIEYLSIRNFDLNSLKNLSAYSIMSLFSAITLPLTFVFIRNYITDNNGIEAAGHWEAMNRISKYYLMFISSLLTLYILPRFSEIDNSFRFRKEVWNFYKKIIPIFILGLAIIFIFRKYIILLILTEEFSEVEELFFWQLLGDLLKVLSLVISFQFLAKRMLWPYLITEATSIIILVLSSLYLIEINGVVGATMAHFVTYLIYFPLILFVFRKQLFSKN